MPYKFNNENNETLFFFYPIELELSDKITNVRIRNHFLTEKA